LPRSQDSVVATGWTVWHSIPGRGKIFISCQNAQTGSRAQPATYLKGMRGSFLGNRAARVQVHHSPAAGADNESSYTLHL